MKVAVLGPLGTYTHEAAYQKFGDRVEYVEQHTIGDVFRALSTTVHLGVVPQENTIFGNVVETYDALRRPDAGFIRGEITLKVDHCLLVRQGVKFHEVQKIMSHEQALGQCQAFIADNFPSVSLVKMPSTASAAQALTTGPPNCAAICSRICATLSDNLEVLREGIQNEANNFTRFYVIAYTMNTRVPFPLLDSPPKKALVRLSLANSPTVKDAKGMVSRNLLQLLDQLELTVVRIDRRPSLEATPFHDTYFIEVQQNSQSFDHRSESNCWTKEVEDAVERLKRTGADIDLAGLW